MTYKSTIIKSHSNYRYLKDDTTIVVIEIWRKQKVMQAPLFFTFQCIFFIPNSS